jgi:uncharacterized protein (DUF934 family)
MSEVEFEEVVKKLIDEVLKDPSKYPDEAKMILVLEQWYERGTGYVDEQEYKVIQGEVSEIVLEMDDERKKVALVPLSIPVVVDLHRYRNDEDGERFEERLAIFTTEGWKSVRVY